MTRPGEPAPSLLPAPAGQTLTGAGDRAPLARDWSALIATHHRQVVLALVAAGFGFGFGPASDLAIALSMAAPPRVSPLGHPRRVKDYVVGPDTVQAQCNSCTATLPAKMLSFEAIPRKT